MNVTHLGPVPDAAASPRSRPTWAGQDITGWPCGITGEAWSRCGGCTAWTRSLDELCWASGIGCMSSSAGSCWAVTLAGTTDFVRRRGPRLQAVTQLRWWASCRTRQQPAHTTAEAECFRPLAHHLIADGKLWPRRFGPPPHVRPSLVFFFFLHGTDLHAAITDARRAGPFLFPSHPHCRDVRE